MRPGTAGNDLALNRDFGDLNRAFPWMIRARQQSVRAQSLHRPRFDFSIMQQALPSGRRILDFAP
jgi:hypothetical protein